MSDKEDKPKTTKPKKKKSALWTGLKWTFRFAALGVGLGLGSELVSEFLFGGLIHGEAPLSKYFLHTATEFMDPIMESIGDYVMEGHDSPDSAMEGFTNFLKSVHEWLGIEGSFEIDAVDNDAPTTPAKPEAPPPPSMDNMFSS